MDRRTGRQFLMDDGGRGVPGTGLRDVTPCQEVILDVSGTYSPDRRTAGTDAKDCHHTRPALGQAGSVLLLEDSQAVRTAGPTDNQLGEYTLNQTTAGIWPEFNPRDLYWPLLQTLPR